MKKRNGKKGNIFVLLAITFHFMKYATLAISKCFEFYNFLFKTYVHIIYTLPIMLERWKTSLVFRLNREACIAEINKNKIKLQFLLQLCRVSTLTKSLTTIYELQGQANIIFANPSANWHYTKRPMHLCSFKMNYCKSFYLNRCRLNWYEN